MAKKATASKMGRPRLFPSGRSQIGVKVADEDRALIERAAELDRRQLSDWVRLTLIDAAKARIQAEEKKG